MYDSGGNDQDSFAAGSFHAGPRTTGMGRQSSNESGAGSAGPMNPASPQERQRKRLRRGGPGTGDEVSRTCTSGLRAGLSTDPPTRPQSAAEGSGSFTDHLQNRLAGVHVQSQPGSQASSTFGSANPSVAPTPPHAGSVEPVANGATATDGGMQQASRQYPSGGQDANAAAYASPQTSMRQLGPSSVQQGYPQQQPMQAQQQQSFAPQSANTSSVLPMNANDPGFRDFFQKVGGAQFPVEKIWYAYSRFPNDFTSALSLLVDAKPVASSRAAYGAVNPSVSSSHGAPAGPTTPMQQQQQQYAQHSSYAAQTPAQQAYLQQQRQMPPSGALHSGQAVSPTGYGASNVAGMVAQQQRAVNGVPVNQSMMQSQQASAAFNPQHQAIAAQQQQLANGGRPLMAAPAGHPQQHQMQPQAGGYGSPTSAAAAAAFAFPPAGTGVAGFTDAHVRHYYQLQEEYRTGMISRDNYKALQQYVNVLNRKAQAQANSGSFYNNNGQASYSQQGVYAQGGYSQRQGTQGNTPKAKPPVPKAHVPQTSGSILARQLMLASGGAPSSKKKSKKRAYASDSDDDGGDYDSAGSGDEYGSRESPAIVAKREALAVEFFNTCTKDNLMELAGTF